MFRQFFVGIVAVALTGCMETAGPTYNGPSGVPISAANAANHPSAVCRRHRRHAGALTRYSTVRAIREAC